MSEAVLDHAIEQIADGLSVDWNAIEKSAPAREQEWARSLRLLNDIVNVHREAAVDFEQTTLVNAAPARTSSALAPDTWGKYRLANKVGEGSYGSVYRAWDSELERDVAIKILHRRVGDTRLKDRLLQEGRALAKIRHNNVVNVHGVEAHGDRVGLCMEFVRGKTLADIVRGQGKMSAAEAVLIGEDLCRALAAVHRAGYIHRDVKAKNVMRDDTGRIVLMDFGTGRTTEAHEGKSDRAGTPLYMAPEVLDGGQASARSDVYSLGVLLYHLVTGDYPVRANSVEELRDAHANREHRWLSELRPDLPVAFMQVVERAIALAPEERFANASELLAALSSVKTNSHPTVMRVLRWVVVVAVVVSGMTALGALTSAMFNVALQRSDFATDTLSDYMLWGRRTSFPPFVILLFVLVVASVLSVTWRLLKAMSAFARAIENRAARRLRAAIHRSRLDEVSVLAPLTLLLSTVAVMAGSWYFVDLILTLILVPEASSEALALLSPSSVGLHNQYRWIFSGIVMFSVAAWYPVARLVRGGQSLHTGVAAGGAIVTCVAMALLHFPHRLMYFSFNQPVEAVQWETEFSVTGDGMRCYVIGERDQSTLLFCPELQPPRTRIVKRDETLVRPLGIRESVFKYFGTQSTERPDSRLAPTRTVQ